MKLPFPSRVASHCPPIRIRFLAPLAGAMLLLSTLPSNAATFTWDGGGGADTNWGNDANWDPDGPVTETTHGVVFEDQSGDLVTTLDSGFDVGRLAFFRINQVTEGGSVTINLGRDFQFPQNNGFQYNATTSGASTLASADMFVFNLNGFRFNPRQNNSNPTANSTQRFLGTLNFNVEGSSFYTDHAKDNTNTLVFGNDSSPAVVNVTQSGTMGQISSSGTADVATSLNIEFGSMGTLNVTGESTVFRVAMSVRSVSQANSALNVTNAGVFNIGEGATLLLERSNTNVTESEGISPILFTTSGTVNHNGTLQLLPDRNGLASISNSGVWKIGSSATLLNSQENVAGAVVPTFLSTGTISGSQSVSRLEYTATNVSGQRITIQSQGTIDPGNGANGSGLTSVGELTFADIDLTLEGTVRFDIGGTGSGEFDVLSLGTGVTSPTGAGTLTIDATNSILELYYVNGFTPGSSYSITILNYGAVAGAFDLANHLSIYGTLDADALNVNNYSITYNGDHAVLKFDAVPEPSTGLLWLAGVAGLAVSQRRKRAGSR
jgi:hypothetical protein